MRTIGILPWRKWLTLSKFHLPDPSLASVACTATMHDSHLDLSSTAKRPTRLRHSRVAECRVVFRVSVQPPRRDFDVVLTHACLRCLQQEPGAEARQDLQGMARAVNRFVMAPFCLDPVKIAGLISRTQKNMHGEQP